MQIRWTQELALDDELLDRQHVEVFRKLEEACASLDRAPADVESAVTAFADALVEHLATEERIMDEALYPERVRHRSAHELFLADFVRLRDELRAKGPISSVADGLRIRIPEWLRFHIRVNDLPLGRHLARLRKLGGVPARRGDGRGLS